LAVRCIVQKSRPSSNIEVSQRSKVKVSGDKQNEKVRHFVRQSSSGTRAAFFQEWPSGALSFASSMPVGKSAHAV